MFFILRVLNYIKQCNALWTLIIPCWMSASYWPMLNPTGNGLKIMLINYIDKDTTIWEREPLERLAKDNQISAFEFQAYLSHTEIYNRMAL